MSRHPANSAQSMPVVRLWIPVLTLILVVAVFFVMRLSNDVPHLVDGTVPEHDSFDKRYVLHPVLAYAHIVPGVLYLAGAPVQLSRRFRGRHYAAHRRLGRAVLLAGLVCGVFGVGFGILHPFGGLLETAAATLFGGYFIVALTLAFVAIKAGNVTRHRRWMIRAFALGLAVGSIRIWVGVFELLGLFRFELGFGIAFWMAFLLHAVAAEAYLHLSARVTPSGRLSVNH